jgi:protein-S-isoprenylcysteine O-methyltransferase Ste14
MRIATRIEREGQFLFRWRSFLPLALIPFAVAAMAQGNPVERYWGDETYHLWAYGCMVLSFAGLAIRWATVAFVPAGSSGRNTRSQRATALNTTGLYSITRNPLYLGNFVTVLGIALSIGIWWFVVLVCLSYWLYIERIIATEEAFLAEKYGAEYAAWAARTPVFLPAFRNWVPPARRASVKTLLRREYNGVLAVGAAFAALELISDLGIEHESLATWMWEDGVWVALLFGTALVFWALRTLKKHTATLRPAAG